MFVLSLDAPQIANSVRAGTAQLLAMTARDTISCLGPLGHGFELSPGRRSVALVSGGLGVAPMPLAAREARAAGMSVTWVHGARSVDELCSEADGDEVIWATDDGSRGFAGTAVSAVPETEMDSAHGGTREAPWVVVGCPDALVAVETNMGC